MNRLRDDTLFRLVQQSDEQAFAVLFDRYKSQLFRHVYGRLGDACAAEDIIQEIFISLWRNRAGVAVEQSLAPYLFRAARNLVLQCYLRQKEKHNYLNTLMELGEPVGYSVEDELTAKELKGVFDGEVEKLPRNMQQAFRLRKYQHKSTAEIADILGLSEQTVKNNLSIALKILRKRLLAKDILFLLFFIRQL